MRTLLASLVFAALSTAASAETTLIDIEKLPSKEVHGIADLTPLAVSASGAPAVVLLDLEKGEVVPPHATKEGLRMMTVLKGELFWGDGSSINPEMEKTFQPGDVLTIPAGLDHWLAARNGSLQIQLIVLDDEQLVPGIQEQMK
ncbi:MAG: cupin domain-containing protein [Roseibium sp.]